MCMGLRCATEGYMHKFHVGRLNLHGKICSQSAATPNATDTWLPANFPSSNRCAPREPTSANHQPLQMYPGNPVTSPTHLRPKPPCILA
ncbi:unnamed protein product [Chondrus crispus]|uniref:Uncharacterized protein n=1 Tax=Chondrus crispus TaxID=2769 RepID=R7QHP4_CHOCR|nr:unnamed protein product [Chondrus crispus]CDF38027.1 unnamed protein product [Chondrus crispus]|eukprot:XP_005717896.1 unnamed protein product [Chondrus crispus]